MGRLFWKFFLAFWGCLILAAALTVGTLYLFKEPPPDVQLAEGPRARFLLNTAEIVMRTDGPNGLRQMLTKMNQDLDKPVPVFAVNTKKEELLGRPIPDDLLEAFSEDLDEDTRPQRGLLKTTAPDGQKWAIFVLRPIRKQNEEHEHRHGRSDDIRMEFGLPPAFGLFVASLASLFFAALLARTYSKPFTRLKNAFGKAAAGQLDVRLADGKTGKDEIGELMTGFDNMASQLQSQINQQKALLHDVSHELRSPLARLNLAAGLARQNPAQIEPSLDRIEREAERLDDLIGQLLRLSRLDSPDHELKWERINLVDLLESVLDDAHFEAEQQGRNINVQGQVDNWASDCLPDALHSAFENVIRNAIRYTPEGGAVTVRYYKDANEHFCVEVSDQGPGLSEDMLVKVFNAFVKSGESSGHGLGLAIVRKAIEIHEGTVTAANRQPNGLKISIRLARINKGTQA